MIPTRQTRGSAADQGVRPTEIRERGGKREKEKEGERKRKKREKGERETQRPGWGISFRFYRPPLPARVQVEHGLPSFLLAGGIRGHIVSASGPWRTSGDWWTLDPWDRDEWDVSLREGAIYCIYYAHATGQWFVEGSFD
jgi:protein ImuB